MSFNTLFGHICQYIFTFFESMFCALLNGKNCFLIKVKVPKIQASAVPVCLTVLRSTDKKIELCRHKQGICIHTEPFFSNYVLFEIVCRPL